MAEAVSSVASVITLLGCAVESAKSLLAFFHSFREAPADVQLWIERLESLQVTLNELQDCDGDIDLQVVLSPRLRQKVVDCACHLDKSAKEIRKIAGGLAEREPNARKQWDRKAYKAWERIKWTTLGNRRKRKTAEMIELYHFEFSLELLRILRAARSVRPVQVNLTTPFPLFRPSQHDSTRLETCELSDSRIQEHPNQPEIHELPTHDIAELPGSPVFVGSASATKVPDAVHSSTDTSNHSRHRSSPSQHFRKSCSSQTIRSSLTLRRAFYAFTLTARGGFLTISQLQSGKSSPSLGEHGPSGFGIGLSLAGPLKWGMRIELALMLHKIATVHRIRYSIDWNLDFVRVVPDHSLIFEVARKGCIEETRKMFAAGNATARDVTRSGMTLLHTACKPGNDQLVQFLIQAGAEINASDENGETPLHRATEFNNNYSVARMLIENGADLENKTTECGTPLHTTCSDTIAEIISKDLALNGISPTSRNMSISHFFAQSSRTTLHIFQNGRQLDLANLWSRDDSGRNCLHFAASAGNLDILPYLLDRASLTDIQARDVRGRSPLHYAPHSSRAVQVIDMLVDRGCDLDAIDERGHTAMHRAAKMHHIGAAKRLTALGTEKRQARAGRDGKRPRDLICVKKQPVLYKSHKSLKPLAESDTEMSISGRCSMRLESRSLITGIEERPSLGVSICIFIMVMTMFYTARLL